MNPEGHFSGNTLHASWRAVNDTAHYSASVEQCDENNVCQQVFHIVLPADRTSLTETSTEFAACSFYNFKVVAFATDGSSLLKETALLHKAQRHCAGFDLEAGLTVALAIVGVFILACAAALVYFHRKQPNLPRLQRVRSKVYSRLYSRERYERPVKKANFLEHVGHLLQQEEDKDLSSFSSSTSSSPLAAEFDDLERLSTFTIQRRSTAATASAVNRSRNRYNDIIPFDATRVRLQPPIKLDNESEESDYINASEIQGRYYAAQGPSEENAALLWELIWQRDVRVVVMLTRTMEGFGFGSIKCAQYWPASVGVHRRFGNIQVQLYDEQQASDYIVRKLDVNRRFSGIRVGGSSNAPGADSSRDIMHVQYTAWPDRSAPDDSGALLQLVAVVRALAKKYNWSGAPWLVHCSAGVGRTGEY